MLLWIQYICWIIHLQAVCAQYFFWSPCHLSYGGECRGLCNHGEVNLGFDYCNIDMGYHGTCCVALPCWYIGGVCRKLCMTGYEATYSLPTTCPHFRSTCCTPVPKTPSDHIATTGVFQSGNTEPTSSTALTTTPRVATSGTTASSVWTSSPTPTVTPRVDTSATTASGESASSLTPAVTPRVDTSATTASGESTSSLTPAVTPRVDTPATTPSSVETTIHWSPGTCGKRRYLGSSPLDSTRGACVFPWVVSIKTTYSQHYCSGVLVSDHAVLTVIGCVDGVSTPQLVLTLGEYDTTQAEATEVQVKVSSITRHPHHTSFTRGNDLVLVEFTEAVNHPCISPVCLPTVNTSPVSLGFGRCLLGGWGDITDANVSNVLEVRPVRVYESSTCSQLLTAMNANGTVPEDVICSLQDDEEDTDCKTDGGSMLMCPDANTQYFLFGIVTEYTCTDHAITLYTDISSHIDWIERNLW